MPGCELTVEEMRSLVTHWFLASIEPYYSQWLYGQLAPVDLADVSLAEGKLADLREGLGATAFARLRDTAVEGSPEAPTHSSPSSSCRAWSRLRRAGQRTVSSMP